MLKQRLMPRLIRNNSYECGDDSRHVSSVIHNRVEARRFAGRCHLCIRNFRQGTNVSQHKSHHRRFRYVQVDPLALVQIANPPQIECLRERIANGLRLKSVKELFSGRHFDREIIVLCVRWFLR